MARHARPDIRYPQPPDGPGEWVPNCRDTDPKVPQLNFNPDFLQRPEEGQEDRQLATNPEMYLSFDPVLAKKKFKVSKEEYESVVNMGPESAQTFLFRFYEFLSGNKLNIDRRLTSTLPPPE